MTKIFSAALLAVSAVGTLLLVPATPAHAVSPACETATAAINKAIEGTGGSFDDITLHALHFTLNSIEASGAEKDAITAYANALLDENVSDLNPYTDELNRVCGF